MPQSPGEVSRRPDGGRTRGEAQTADRWLAVEAIFHRVRASAPEARPALLDESCGGDDALRREVASLLDAAEADDRLEDEVAGAIQRTAAAAIAPAERRVGAYRLLRELGHGGMGVVYLAERADGAYQQQVAVKLVKRHVAGAEARRRFLAERQILARLDHPAIARLLDGGTTDDGTPYLVMEWVDGEHIDSWCRRQNLDVEARLRLFLEVCDAVEAAHRQLIVHRDLKPSNILVGDDGRPRLLDFGIAKLLDDESAATATIERRMTPGYASPEQVLGGTITTATDVYALGAVLYELLAGRPTIATGELTPVQVLNAVCQETPPRPSVAAAQEGAAGSTRARRLGGELDAIVMTALRKEPERRYPSMRALADDVRAHLDGRPVAAHSERLGYLAGKWLRRHAAAVSAALLVVLALAAGLVARTLEARRANRAAATAERVSGFLASLLAEADPESSRGQEPTVLDAVLRGAERLESELADDPLIRAHLLEVIGEVLRERGAFEAAEAQLARSLALREQHGAAPAALADSLEALGDLAIKRSRFAAAEGLLRRALAIRQAARPAAGEALAQAQTLLGIVRVRSGRFEEAAALFESALALRREVYGDEHEQVAKSLQNLGWVRSEQGAFEAAAAYFRRALDMKRRVLPADHPSLTASLQSLAVVVAARGAHDEAHALRREAVELTRRVYGEDHPRYAEVLAEMASQLHDLRRYDEAEAAYRGALAIQEPAFPEGHVAMTYTLNNLASLHEDRGDPAAAEPLFVRSLAMRRDLFDDQHPAVARALYNLARVRRTLGRTVDSEALFRRALAVWRQTRPAGHADIGKTARRLGALLLDTGRAGEAEPLLEEAATIFAGEAPDHPERAAAEAALASARAGRAAGDA